MTEATFRPLDSLQVMAYIIQRCKQLQTPFLNTTKLQKLMYCCYGTCLAKCGYRLCDESPEAWQYGPVFPRTLRTLQCWGYEWLAEHPTEDVAEQLPQEVVALIDATLKTFGKFAANQLSNWTHIKGSPWSVASKDGAVLKEQISDALISEYFKKHVLKHS
jgi:uncharacterized phage-associated protein